MDERASEELRALRDRAYGPGADIHRDPAALQRLRVLEDLHRGAPVRDADGVVAQHPVPHAPAPVAREPVATRDAIAQAPARWTRRRLAVLWVVSLVSAVVVAVAATLATVPRAPAGIDARVVGTVRVDPDFDVDRLFGPGSDTQGFHEFHGLVAVRARDGWQGGDGETCLTLYAASGFDEDRNGYSGPIHTGCGAGGFPTTVQLTVGNRAPRELRERFPDGSALQFVLDGSQLIVLTDAE